MKRFTLFIAVILVFLMTFGLAACGGEKAPSGGTTSTTGTTSTDSDEDEETETKSSSPDALKLEATGWTAQESSSSYVLWYGVTITNPNKKYTAIDPNLKLTVKDAEGKILATVEDYPGNLAPGDSLTVGNATYIDNGIPATVDFSVSVGKDYWSEKDNLAVKSSELIISNVSIYDDSYSNTVTGEIENTSDLDIDFGEVYVVFYNEAGDIIGGDYTYFELFAGEKTAFELNVYPKFPAYASYKLFATGGNIYDY